MEAVAEGFDRLEFAADQGLTLFTYTAEPGSRSEETLHLHGSWGSDVGTGRAGRAGEHQLAVRLGRGRR
jgi:hypothetical protein